MIHSPAFAGALYDLHLNGSRLALSILGFNSGIEAIQLCIVGLVVPGLILLSQARLYAPFRIGGAILAVIAALIWVIERVTE